MSDDSSSDGQRQCHRVHGVVTVDVELDAAMALADMAGVEQQPPPPVLRAPPPAHPPPPTTQEDEEELASTRLSLELGKVGIQQASSPCSSSSSAGAGGHHHHHHHQQQQMPTAGASAAAPATGYGPRPRHALTEAEKEAKRLRRVLANRESARQTILRRQAIRDELARKVADLSSQNDNMKKEKDMVMQEYLSLKEANKQLKEQVVARTAKKAPAVVAAMSAQHQAESAAAAVAVASPPATPPRPGFLQYTSAPPAPVPVPVPYVWGSWPPGPAAAAAGYEHHGSSPAAGPPPPPGLCLQPCAWYYPVMAATAADPRGSPSSASVYAQPQNPPAGLFHQDPRGGGVAAAEPVGSGGGGATAEEDTDDDPCSLTLGLDVVADKRTAAPVSVFPAAGPAGGVGGGAGAAAQQSDRDKAATAAEARKRRKELTKLKHMHAAAAAGRPGGEQW